LPQPRAITVRRLASARQVCALLALGILVAFASAASAGNIATHRRPHAIRRMLSNVAMPTLGSISDQDVPDDGQKYELKLVRQSGEILDVVYRVGDTYILDSLYTLSDFLRDSHNDEVKSYNPRTFDVLHNAQEAESIQQRHRGPLRLPNQGDQRCAPRDWNHQRSRALGAY